MEFNLEDYKGGLKNPNVKSAVNAAADAIEGVLPQKEVYSGQYGGITKGMDAAYDKINNYISVIPGGQTIAALMKANKILGKGVAALGAGTSGMTAQDAILGSSFFQMTPLGLVNGFGGKRSHTLENGMSERDTLSNAGSGYGGFVQNWLDTQQYSNKKYGLLSSGARRKANDRIDKYNNRMNTLTYISNSARDRMEMANNMADQNYLNYNMQLYGGYDPRTTIGRQGMKIEYIKRAQKIARNGCKLEKPYFIPEDWNPTTEPQKFQNGGSVNVIPTGALHARLHHMDTGDNITKKGIPVVDNDNNQQAEIERDEIIFRKEVTEKIEKLCKDGSDEAALECGKLLTEEIINNTDDKSGLVPKLLDKKEDGGVMPKMQDPAEFIKQNPINPSKTLNPKLPKTPPQTQKGLDPIKVGINSIKTGIQAGKAQNEANKQALAASQTSFYDQMGDMNGNEQLFNQLVPAAYGGFKLPEFKSSKELLEYLHSSGRDGDDYDYEKAFADPEVYNRWRKEESAKPGQGHWSNKYKKPSHMTFSVESIYNSPLTKGGRWITADGQDMFIVSPYLAKQHSLLDYLNYMSQYEPNAGIIYKGVTYKNK